MTERELESLIYGDRVELDWSDANGHTTRIQGLYGGHYDKSPEKVVVTITSDINSLRGTIVITNPENLTLVEHPDVPEEYHYNVKDDENDTVSWSNSGDYNPSTVTYAYDNDTYVYDFDRLTLIKMRDNIMDNFDFDKVHRTMVALDWQWVDENLTNHVPDIAEIRNQARSELDRIINAFGTPNQYYCGGTGGFEAKLFIDDDTKHPELELSFCVDDWYESYDESEEYHDDYTKRKNAGGPILAI